MEDTLPDENTARRKEPRTLVDLYYSVEFSIKGLDAIYQFIIYNISSRGVCILVKANSAILDKIKVGDIFDMKYYPIKLLGHAEHLKTEIRHITLETSGRYKNHYLIGLEVIEKLSPDETMTSKDNNEEMTGASAS